ncbi:hypothetical protein C1H46_019042 [Malus baccata]|uniref:Metalloenzyme domain-containing protein n=1 Tax=Malus baccata TaxID=106549 RepID=A0A540M9I2_MALBA|nr:hypothetical protein C1H46_019042 [Malus baccata]
MGSSGFDWKLPDHPKLPKGKVIELIVLDRWGKANTDQYNCIHVVETPVMDLLNKGAPKRWRLVRAHGTAMGLPTEDDIGNSEMGHNALDAGRIFAQGGWSTMIIIITITTRTITKFARFAGLHC